MEKSTQNHAIVKTIVELAKHMNMDVVAEGVEEETQLQALTLMHCEMLQGYFIARPMNAQSMTEFLAKSQVTEPIMAA